MKERLDDSSPQEETPTPTEEVLLDSLSPDQLVVEGLERLMWREPGNPNMGFVVRPEFRKLADKEGREDLHHMGD